MLQEQEKADVTVEEADNIQSADHCIWLYY
jgi:hypothetical protein